MTSAVPLMAEAPTPAPHKKLSMKFVRLVEKQ
jgi:hypothetical protein